MQNTRLLSCTVLPVWRITSARSRRRPKCMLNSAGILGSQPTRTTWSARA
jgi:hypothetical protein